MATHYFKAIHHHRRHHSLWRRDSIDSPSPTSICSFFLKPTNHSLIITTSSSTTIPYSVSSSTASSSGAASTSQLISFDLLQQHLSSQNYRQADEETRRLLILLAGEPAQKRGYVFFSEVQFISIDDLKAIDELWKRYSNNRFGYSVQKKIWNKVGRDFTKLFVQIGWMKKLETEVVQYGYRAFPEEFIWEIDGENPPPQGHLPLTNALRGTQLFSSILTHPAFCGDGDDEIDDDDIGKDAATATGGGGGGGGGVVREPLTNKVFKADYTF